MKRYEFLIFITGAVTLSLEVLASRIMTPYFGVSLYIWSGILSITLVFLAVGYRIGGSISATISRKSAEFVFVATPIVSALAIFLSAIVYPVVFPLLSQTNLIVGSFVGATLLLALPLIGLSAMNPLLIGLRLEQTKTGDAGAGRVFFISTMGSVAGVLFTAFLFIPNITNFRAILVLGFMINVITILLVITSQNLIPKQKRNLLATGLMVAVLCGALFAAKGSFLQFVSSAYANQLTYKIRAEYTSMFGNIKVVEVARKDGTGSMEKYLIQDGLVQNRTDENNSSVSMYTHVLESLTHAYAPKAKDVLVLGLGAGIVPQHFQAEGKTVAVVEINAAVLKAASENFGFDPRGIRIHLEDARTFVRKCDRAFDVAVVDLFLGDNVPDYLMTKEFFGELRRCIRADGALVMNAFFDDKNDEPNRRLLATIASSFPKIYLSGISGSNAFIVGSAAAAPKKIVVEAIGLPKNLAAAVEFSVSKSQRIPRNIYRNSKPVSDDHNIFSVLFANANMAERKYLAGLLPPHMLVN